VSRQQWLMVLTATAIAAKTEDSIKILARDSISSFSSRSERLTSYEMWIYIQSASLVTQFLIASPEQRSYHQNSQLFVCSQISPTCNTSVVTTAEIVTAMKDGNTLIYTDGIPGKIGFVNIASTDPTNPTATGTINFLGTDQPVLWYRADWPWWQSTPLPTLSIHLDFWR
jgi:hypothetical protein